MSHLFGTRSHLARTSLLGLLISLGACGGGTPGELRVSFNYEGVQDSYAFNQVEARPMVEGLEGHSARCSLETPSGANTGLPEGVTLDRDTCVISGEAMEAGTFTPRVKLTVPGLDGAVYASAYIHLELPSFRYGNTDDVNVPWGEEMEPAAPAWTGYVPRTGDNVVYSLIPGDQLPRGVFLDPATGQLHGTATQLDFDTFSYSGVKARVVRNGHSFEQFASPMINIGLPKVEYPDIHAKVGQRYSQLPNLASSLQTPEFVVTYSLDPLWSGDCPSAYVERNVDAHTGELSGTSSLSTSCMLVVQWSISDGVTTFSRSSNTYLRVDP